MNAEAALLAVNAAIADLELAKKAIEGTPPLPEQPILVSHAAPSVQYALPRETYDEMTKFYGTPSRNPNNLEWFSFPCDDVRLYDRNGARLKDYSGDARIDHRTHKLLAGRLTNALAEIFFLLGEEEFRRQGWHVYGGSHNYRPKVGGSSLSTHSWAAAIDMNPSENPFKQTSTTFAASAIDVMERWGFLSGGRAWNKDWMHFQAVVPNISSGSYYSKNGLPRNIVPAF